MISIDPPLTILKELRDHIIPLADEELFLLEKSIVTEGCREPLIVWERSEDQLVLVDGHNRFKICQKHGIPFQFKKLLLKNIDEAKVWMIDNQVGRRNLTPDQASFYRGLKYLSLKKARGGYYNVKSKGQSDTSTSELVSKFFKVSESTVKRDAKFAEGLNVIGTSNPRLKTKILTGEVKVKKGDVQALADATNRERLTIKDETDLLRKAKVIRERILEEVEVSLKDLNNRATSSDTTLNDSVQIFMDKSDRLRRIKGMILNAMNRAINDMDSQAIKELKRLVEKLEGELFD